MSQCDIVVQISVNNPSTSWRNWIASKKLFYKLAAVYAQATLKETVYRNSNEVDYLELKELKTRNLFIIVTRALIKVTRQSVALICVIMMHI